MQNRQNQYKARTTENLQEKRRALFLEKQKQQRTNVRDYVRTLVDSTEVTESTPETTTNEIQMSNENVEIKQKKERTIQLMLPEPMLEIPSNLESEWCSVPIPFGAQRCLLVSAHGSTSSRSQDGKLIERFSTMLPNGSKNSKGGRDIYCILDCIKVQGLYFILDLMVWKGHTYHDCTYEFRMYWLHTKLSEMEHSIHPLVPLPVFDCSLQGIKNALDFKWNTIMNSNSNSTNVNNSNNSGGMDLETANTQTEGLLFYCKETHYELGTTPLVCWMTAPDIVALFSQQPQSFNSQ